MKKNRCALAYANAPLGTQWGKRILSTLLAVVLCLGLLPGAAFAAGTYTPADVDAVLDRVVKNQTTVGAGDTAYDVDKDGKLTSWDAKRMLDAMPSSIKVNAMQIDGNADSTERPSWVSLEIQDGKLVSSTTINKFFGALGGLIKDDSIYPEAAALDQGKLVLRASHFTGSGSTSNTLLQVDPDSFVAREQPRPSDSAAGSYYIATWDDATTLSNGQLLGVFLDPTANGGIAFFLMDGENNKKITIPNTISGFPKLVGIAAAGKDTDGNELLYGITSGRELYSFTLSMSNGELSVSSFKKLGDVSIPWELFDGKYFSGASLLYDTASGYLLAAATYFSTLNGTLYSDDIGSALYLIDPAHPSDYVTVTQRDGVVLNSLYQYTQKSTEGVQLYLSESAVSVKAGQSVELPEAKAYEYSTNTSGLVENKDTSVIWTSSDVNEDVIAIQGNEIIAKDVTERKMVTLTATATAHEKTATGTVTVTVNPNTGSKVGALINTSVDNPDYVWATIDLDNLVAGTFQTVTSDVELASDPITATSKNEKGYLSGGGYAQGLLWGNYSINSGTHKDPIFSYYYYTYTFDPTASEKESSWSNTAHDSGRQIADLTGAPETTVKYTKDGQTLTVTDPGYPVFVDRGGHICYFNGNGESPIVFNQDTTYAFDTNNYSAITYVGDLTVGEALALGEAKKVISESYRNTYLSNCDSDVTCHVYYALKQDDTDTGAELQQIILFPQIDTNDNGTTLSYKLCRFSIGYVPQFNLKPDSFNVKSTSMDLIETDDGFRLLVARSNAFAGHSIWYIDLSSSKKSLSATLIGDLTQVQVTSKGEPATVGVNGVSALYHKGNMTLDKADMLRIAGWNDVQASQSAPMAAPAISVLSGEDASGPDASTSVEISITADKLATNGKWTVTYNKDKLAFVSATQNDSIVYAKTHHDSEKGTVTLAFASRTGINQGNALFTLTFTGDGSDKDVTVTCDELNEPARTPSGGGGGGGGSTGTDSAVALPSGVTGGSVSSSTDKAKPGDTVTITVEPDEGYVPGTVKVVDKDGKEIAVKDLGDGKYSFVMPTGKVDVQVTFAPATGGFADVPTDTYYREAVLWAVEKGVTNGVSDTLFGPDQACTRAQIVTFLWRAAGSPEPTAAGGFTDVPADAYYAKAVAWAVENGITTGVAEGVFAPDATCTRAQSVTFLFRALDGTAGTGSSFTDVPADAWYAAAVAWAVEKGVTNGISESRFGPDGDCTRAQIVTFLWRAMK